jgi:hypothetical protein
MGGVIPSVSAEWGGFRVDRRWQRSRRTAETAMRTRGRGERKREEYEFLVDRKSIGPGLPETNSRQAVPGSSGSRFPHFLLCWCGGIPGRSLDHPTTCDPTTCQLRPAFFLSTIKFPSPQATVPVHETFLSTPPQPPLLQLPPAFPLLLLQPAFLFLARLCFCCRGISSSEKAPN